MTWTKLGAEWPDEARHLDHEQYRLHVDATCYSNRRGLDLLLPKDDVRRFAEVAEPDKVIARLVRDGWWQDRGGYWWIGCRFPEWQRTREQVDARREVNNRAQQRKRLHDKGDHSLCLPRTCPLVASSADTPSDTSAESASTSARSSERNGTAATTSTAKKGETNFYGLGACVVCGSFEKLGPDGTCASCALIAASGS